MPYINYPGYLAPSFIQGSGPMTLSPPPTTSSPAQPSVATPWTLAVQTSDLGVVVANNPSVLNANGVTIPVGGGAG